jgi:hypothetical protein
MRKPREPARLERKFTEKIRVKTKKNSLAGGAWHASGYNNYSNYQKPN